MGTDQPISRRDWFRLRTVNGPSRLSEANSSPGLQPVAAPPNYAGLDVTQLPPVHEAVLSREEAQALFADIEKHAEDVRLVARMASGAESRQPPSLTVVRDKLIGGEVTKVQIRYRWQGRQWIDTLERKPDGVRLVRIGHPDSGNRRNT